MKISLIFYQARIETAHFQTDPGDSEEGWWGTWEVEGGDLGILLQWITPGRECRLDSKDSLVTASNVVPVLKNKFNRWENIFVQYRILYWNSKSHWHQTCVSLVFSIRSAVILTCSVPPIQRRLAAASSLHDGSCRFRPGTAEMSNWTLVDYGTDKVSTVHSTSLIIVAICKAHHVFCRNSTTCRGQGRSRASVQEGCEWYRTRYRGRTAAEEGAVIEELTMTRKQHCTLVLTAPRDDPRLTDRAEWANSKNRWEND